MTHQFFNFESCRRVFKEKNNHCVRTSELGKYFLCFKKVNVLQLMRANHIVVIFLINKITDFI